MDALKQDLEKLKYDSFLNGIEVAFKRHCSDDPDETRKMLEFAKELIERFVTLYGDGQDSELRTTAQKLVMEYFMHLN